MPSTSRVAVASTCASRRKGTQWATRAERLSAECGVRVRAMDPAHDLQPVRGFARSDGVRAPRL